MKLNRQEELALLFTSELVKVPHTYVSLTVIARNHGISMLFLKKIAGMLKAKGIVKSKEGIHGGYMLVKAPDEVSARDVLSALRHEDTDGGCLGGCRCPIRPSCIPQSIRFLLSHAWERYLSDVTIDQFVR